MCCVVLCCVVLCCVVLCCVVLSKVSAVRVRAGCWADGLHTHTHTRVSFCLPKLARSDSAPAARTRLPCSVCVGGSALYKLARELQSLLPLHWRARPWRLQRSHFQTRAQEPRPTPNISGLYLARASRAKLVGIGSRRPLCERWRRSSSGLLMALGKILLGRWTADIYLEDCLMIRSTGVDNEDCA